MCVWQMFIEPTSLLTTIVKSDVRVFKSPSSAREKAWAFTLPSNRSCPPMLLYLHSDHGLRLYVHLPGIEPGPGISPEALPTRERQDATRSLHRRVIRNDHFYHSKSRFSEGPMEVWNVGCSLPPSIRLSVFLSVYPSLCLSPATPWDFGLYPSFSPHSTGYLDYSFSPHSTGYLDYSFSPHSTGHLDYSFSLFLRILPTIRCVCVTLYPRSTLHGRINHLSKAHIPVFAVVDAAQCTVDWRP